MSDQTYLGRSVVVLKRENCGDLAELTKEEMLDFLELVGRLENAFRKAFNATMFNWSCLMNLAYQNVPPDPHVHWHFRPRYDHTVTFFGLDFIDPNFGKHYDLSTDRDIGVVRKKITEEVKKYI
jgi:diadenosine tetraphosphate (Ap4A) HIT family hydrolase